MKKTLLSGLLVIVCLLSETCLCNAQQRPYSSVMTGISGGPLLFFGDIGSMGTGYTTGISGRFALSEYISIQGFLNYGSFSDSDEGTPNSSRDYAFSTTLAEPGISVMYTFFVKRGEGLTHKGTIKQWDKWSGLVFGGIALPWTQVVPQNHLTFADLDREKGVSFALLAGATLQYGLNPHWFLTLSFIPHYLFSDYLDGYTSPQSLSNDIYHCIHLGLCYRL